MVRPEVKLSPAQALIAQHYSSIVDIFAASQLQDSAGFDLAGCMALAETDIRSWQAFTDSLPHDPKTMTFCCQARDHKTDTDVYEIVTQAAERLDNWLEVPFDKAGGNSFNLLWTWSKPRVDFSRLLVWQRVNRFPNSKALTRKDQLKRSLNRYCKLPGSLGAAFNCFPDTYTLPGDYKTFVGEFMRIEEEEPDKTKNIWIMKPVGSSRGRGIFLVSSVHDLSYSEAMVCQRYIPVSSTHRAPLTAPLTAPLHLARIFTAVSVPQRAWPLFSEPAAARRIQVRSPGIRLRQIDAAAGGFRPHAGLRTVEHRKVHLRSGQAQGHLHPPDQ